MKTLPLVLAEIRFRWSNALLIGLLGGAIGVTTGCGAFWMIGRYLMEVDSAGLVPDLGLILAVLIGTPCISLLSSYPPTIGALTGDPAKILLDG